MSNKRTPTGIDFWNKPYCCCTRTNYSPIISVSYGYCTAANRLKRLMVFTHAHDMLVFIQMEIEYNWHLRGNVKLIVIAPKRL